VHDFLPDWTSPFEGTLEDRERFYRTLVEQTRDFMTVVAVDGTILFKNRSTDHPAGYHEAELVGRNVFDFIHPDDLGRVRDAINLAMCGTTVSAIEHRFRFKDGSWHVFESIAHHIRDFPSGPIAVITSRDLTDRRSLEAQIRQVQRLELLGRMTAMVAHEFRSVLSSIVDSAESLLESELPPSVERHVSQLHRTAHQAHEWTQRVLLFSRLERESPDEPVNVNDVVIRLATLLHHLLGPDYALTLSLSASAPWVALDEVLLGQVIVNLVVNAREAMPNGGPVTITTINRRAPDDDRHQKVVLSVSDTGFGMSDEVRSHIFDPFFGTTPAAGSRGLGLRTVFEIVGRAGGCVDVDTEAGGATFHIALPAQSWNDRDGPD
jgi:two-component system, cell cycle sensor histidine kinase and response regulator CckA